MIEKLIAKIRVQDLFGLYTYQLPESGDFSNAVILYGDNGVGKSTLLRLAFHLLSAANDRGHRTALYSTEFKRLEVELESGITLSASFSVDRPIRVMTLEVLRGDKKLAIWEYERPEKDHFLESEGYMVELDSAGEPHIRRRRRQLEKRDNYTVPRGNQAYIAELSLHVPTMFILNAERRLDSDSVSDPSDEMELRRVMHFEQPKRINELVVRSREIALSQALNAAGRWVGGKAVIGANQGSMNVHSVYVDVLHHLLAPTTSRENTLSESTDGTLQKQLLAIEARTAEHARYELATPLFTTDFRKALSARSKSKSNLAAELLKPYIKSLEGRLEAVEPIYQIIDRFVSMVNGFLSDKSISFKLSQGFSIQNRLGNQLSPAQLSSGEQQLLLLFCYVLTARDKASVFMIDEPEISLNIKWQRQLVQSLLDITQGATIQFIFASHSMELLAQHRDRVIKLVNNKI